MEFNIYTVEVPFLLTFFCFTFTGSVYTNLIIFRSCYLILGYNKSECALLGKTYNNDTTKVEKLVEPHAAVINMTRTAIESLFTVILCLFIGPWSDRFGRKPVLIACLAGYTMSYLGILIFSYFEKISPWYLIICSFPIMVTGGRPSYFTNCLSYITDVTNNENRSIRMAIFEAVATIGILLGNVSSSYVFYATNYMTVFSIAAAFCAFGVFYTIVFIPESLQIRETEGKFREFFQLSNLRKMVQTTIKKREHFNRETIFLILSILTIYKFISDGDSSVMFLYFREKFEWTLTKYTLYSSITNVLWSCGAIIGTYFLHKLFKLKEAVLLLVGFISTATGAILLGIGNSDNYIYAAGGLRCLGGVINPMSNSLVSKLVPEAEVGKIFAMIMATAFTVGTASAPLYTSVYDNTISKDPGIFNYITAGLYTFNIILATSIIFVQSFNHPTYSQFINEERHEEISENGNSIHTF